MEKIKVLLVATEPAVGMIPFVITIINTLSADGRFEVCALLAETDNFSYSGKISENVKVEVTKKSTDTLGRFMNKVYPRSAISKLATLVKIWHPDVVHFLNGEYAFANYISRCHFKSKLCLTIHDLVQHEREKRPLIEKMIHFIIRKGCLRFTKESQFLTTSSQMQFEKLKMLYPQKQIFYTHFPSLVTPVIKNGEEKVPELKNMGKYILFFGSVDKYKGVDLLIKAFESLEDSFGYKLVIAGKGIDYKSKSRNIIRLNRFIKDEEVADLFKNSSFVVYPYISATMSGVLSIAYYFRKRVLLSDVPFFKENATPSCSFFKANDLGEIKNKLISMMKNPGSLITPDYYSKIYSDIVLANDYYQLYSHIKDVK